MLTHADPRAPASQQHALQAFADNARLESVQVVGVPLRLQPSQAGRLAASLSGTSGRANSVYWIAFEQRSR